MVKPFVRDRRAFSACSPRPDRYVSHCVLADREWRPRRSDHRSSLDASDVDRRVTHVRVIDPGHALYGSRLPVSDRRSGRGPKLLVVRLPDGRERSIARSATDWGSGSEERQPAAERQMHVSVRTLLPVANHVRAVLASRHEDFESGQLPDRTSARPEHETLEGGVGSCAPDLAPAAGGAASATGTANRSANPTPERGTGSGTGGTSC
jgi:hypothetical protein